MLSAETGSSLLFSGIAPSPISSTNSGLLIAADVASGLAAPLHAPFSSIEDRANGWRLPLNGGFSGLAFGPAAQQLFGAASSGPQSASNLLTMDPYTGVQKAAPVPIVAAAQALYISDLATVPGGYYQLYGLGRPVATPSASFQLHVIDPGSGEAVAIADQPAWLASLSSADALAFGPDGTLYVGGQERVGNAAVLYVQQPNGDDPLVTRHTLTDSILGMDARVVGSGSQGAQVEVLTVVAGGQLRWLDPASGQFIGTVALSDPVRGIAGDIAFHPAPDSLTLQQVHHADFETGADGYTADNAIQVMPGMWHHSPGRWDDKLINHTYGQQKMPGFNWYYGQFETSSGGGTYLTNYHHAGILTSPLISVPECATTTLSFSYLLDVRQPLDADFVEVWAQFTNEGGQVQRTRLMSRAEGTLPQTGNRWLTATADLSPFAGREVQIQFLFDTGNVPDVDPEGWYVDDVMIASMPKAVCGYKWYDLDYDGRWGEDEPGLNDRQIYADVNGNGRYDPAVPAQTLAGALDANTFASGRRVVHPDGHAVLEVSATGEPIWAMPDPFQPSRKVLAWGDAAGEEAWPVGPMLRAAFPTAVHTVALDVARADATGSTRVVLQAFDQHSNRIAEQVRTLADAQWQTLTVSVTGGEIAYVKASVDQGTAKFNDLRYWGTAPAVEGDPAFVTRNNGQRDGAFWFDRLPPGEYMLREVIPEMWVQSYPGPELFAHPITVVPGQTVHGRWETAEVPNFGDWLSASVSGAKFEDQDADGQPREPGEPGEPEWRIYVDYNGNDIRDDDEPYAVTGDDGTYIIEDIRPGSWKVREEAREGWTNSYPSSGYHEATLVAGQTVTGLDFGNWTWARIDSSVKFEDLDADGQPREADEPRLPGWTIFVDYNGNGILDDDEPSDVTGADGEYILERIRPGRWQVRELPQDEWTNSYPPGGFYEQEFLSGQTVTGLNFGNWTWARIESSVKFEDLDADGQPREADEPGSLGWTLFVDYNGNGILDDGEPFDVTGADGQYTIERIRPGTWQVRELPQDEWTNSYPPEGFYEQTFLSGQTVTGLNFGNWTWARIDSSFKFEDLDADGQPREDGEPGLFGWTIFVDYNGNGILDDDEPFDVTGADGQYTVERIRPGTWQVRELLQDDWANSYPPGGFYEQTFLSGQTVTGLDFGNWTWASISGEKYEVENGPARGSGLPGWTIYVDYNDNETWDSGEPFAVSGVDGSYTIPEIKPGTYKVREVLQAGWKISQPIQGFHELTLRSRQHIPEMNFGNEKISTEPQVVQFVTPMSVYRRGGSAFRPDEVTGPVLIEGRLWHDLNLNGIFDSEDLVAREGWWVFLDLNGNGVWDSFDPNRPEMPPEPFALTDAVGRYAFPENAFEGVAPGTYTLLIDRSSSGLSDGAFDIATFPGPQGHPVEIVDLNGTPGIAGAEPGTMPLVLDFGFFVYSPFIRPADDHYGRMEKLASPWRSGLLTALEPWQSFNITNTTGSDFEITELQKKIDTTKIAVADQFVTVFLKQGETLIPILDPESGTDSSVIRINPPIVVPGGETVQFFAFYDPAIRDGDRVIEQYPDWYGANKNTHPAHTFDRDDHLSVIMNTDATFRVDLVGGSTYDSDIHYDGAVDPLDFRQLDDLLRERTIATKLFIPFGDDLFEPTADINARCPNEAAGIHGTCHWILQAFPARELGLGDFGPLNVEWDRARAPFLDLDPDNSSGAKSVDFATEFPGEDNPTGNPIKIVDSDARFANRGLRVLAELSISITPDSRVDGDQILVDESQLSPTISVINNGPFELRLVGNPDAPVADFNEALQLVTFHTNARTGRTVDIEIWATGAISAREDSSFTRLAHDWELVGNIALARIAIEQIGNAELERLVSSGSTSGESESRDASQEVDFPFSALVTVVDPEASDTRGTMGGENVNQWQNTDNRYDVNADGLVTPLDVLQIGNHLDAHVASTPLPTRADASAPYLDVNGDGYATALDALLVINHLSAEQLPTAEGEGPESPDESASVENLRDIPGGELGSFVMPQNEFDGRLPTDQLPSPERASNDLQFISPADATERVAALILDNSRIATGSRFSFTDDHSESLQVAKLDLEELLSDLVEEIAAAGLP